MAFIVPEEIEQYAEEHTTPPTDAARRAGGGDAARRSTRRRCSPARSRAASSSCSCTRRERAGCSSSGRSPATRRSRWRRASPAGGDIDTCEVEREARLGSAALHRAGGPVGPDHHPHGAGLDTIEALGGEWDLVFIDADKPNYLNYYEAVVPRLTERGIIVADNTLWSGKVLDRVRRLGGHGRDPRVQRPGAERRPRRLRAADDSRRRHAHPARVNRTAGVSPGS